jgi:hypothetical protein
MVHRCSDCCSSGVAIGRPPCVTRVAGGSRDLASVLTTVPLPIYIHSPSCFGTRTQIATFILQPPLRIESQLSVVGWWACLPCPNGTLGNILVMVMSGWHGGQRVKSGNGCPGLERATRGLVLTASAQLADSCKLATATDSSFDLRLPSSLVSRARLLLSFQFNFVSVLPLVVR